MSARNQQAAAPGELIVQESVRLLSVVLDHVQPPDTRPPLSLCADLWRSAKFAHHSRAPLCSHDCPLIVA